MVLNVLTRMWTWTSFDQSNLCILLSRITSMPRKKLTIHQLESHLQDLDEFEEPKIDLEQYATPPHIAALILNTVDSQYDDIEGKLVADLGCGTGRLLLGSLFVGARLVYGFDIDEAALNSCLTNLIEKFGDEGEDRAEVYRVCSEFNLIQADISNDNNGFWSRWENVFDTVIMNPPFGTKHNKNADMLFLKRAIHLAQDSVYSLHKTSTRQHILRQTQLWGVRQAKPIAQIRYNLNNTYKFHKKTSVDIEVDLWQIKVS